MININRRGVPSEDITVGNVPEVLKKSRGVHYCKNIEEYTKIEFGIAVDFADVCVVVNDFRFEIDIARLDFACHVEI